MTQTDFAFGPVHRTRLLFEWDQSKCPQEKHPDPKERKPLFLKPLADVWRAFPQHDADTTLLVDDTPAKAGRNPPHLLYSPREWTVANETGAGELSGAVKWMCVRVIFCVADTVCARRHR